MSLKGQTRKSGATLGTSAVHPTADVNWQKADIAIGFRLEHAALGKFLGIISSPVAFGLLLEVFAPFLAADRGRTGGEPDGGHKRECESAIE